MTEEQKQKVAELVQTTEKYLPLMQERLGKNNPFAFSAAKYYPVLEKLASE